MRGVPLGPAAAGLIQLGKLSRTGSAGQNSDPDIVHRVHRWFATKTRRLHRRREFRPLVDSGVEFSELAANPIGRPDVVVGVDRRAVRRCTQRRHSKHRHFLIGGVPLGDGAAQHPVHIVGITCGVRIRQS